MNAVAWHPKEPYLAYGGDEKDKYSNQGLIKIFGFRDKQDQRAAQ